MSHLESELVTDMDAIAGYSRRALNKLAVDDVDGAERLVEDIRNIASSWEEP